MYRKLKLLESGQHINRSPWHGENDNLFAYFGTYLRPMLPYAFTHFQTCLHHVLSSPSPLGDQVGSPVRDPRFKGNQED